MGYKNGYYDCLGGAYRYFQFQDESQGMPKIIDQSHPIYKQRKKPYKLKTNL